MLCISSSESSNSSILSFSLPYSSVFKAFLSLTLYIETLQNKSSDIPDATISINFSMLSGSERFKTKLSMEES